MAHAAKQIDLPTNIAQQKLRWSTKVKRVSSYAPRVQKFAKDTFKGRERAKWIQRVGACRSSSTCSADNCIRSSTYIHQGVADTTKTMSSQVCTLPVSPVAVIELWPVAYFAADAPPLLPRNLPHIPFQGCPRFRMKPWEPGCRHKGKRRRFAKSQRLERSTVRKTQNRHLCRAFPIMFYTLPNIFRKESRYFRQYLNNFFFYGNSLKFWTDNPITN